MPNCAVCDRELPSQRGPRARVYCSRACQQRAHRARERAQRQHTIADTATVSAYAHLSAAELAQQVNTTAQRIAAALEKGTPVTTDDQAALTGITAALHERTRRPLNQPAPEARQEAVNEPPHESSRDDSEPRQQPQRQASRDDHNGETERHDSTRIATRPQSLSRKKAADIIDAAKLIKAPDHADSAMWHLRSPDAMLGFIEPTYGVSGRNGWTYTTQNGNQARDRYKTRREAAVRLAMAWERIVTAKARRTITGD